MSKGSILAIALMGIATIGLAGCQQPSMEEMMKQPARPAALDQLNVWVGTWQSEMTMEVEGSDETMTSTGVNETRWAADDWLLVEESTMTMENGEQMKGIAVWMYDPKAEKFRYWWFANWNMVMEGTAEQDVDEGVWRMHGKGQDLKSGHRWTSKGKAWFTDGDTVKWEGADYMGLIPMKFMEMHGTNQKQ